MIGFFLVYIISGIHNNKRKENIVGIEITIAHSFNAGVNNWKNNVSICSESSVFKK